MAVEMKLLRRILGASSAVVLVVTATAAVLFVSNAPPETAPISREEIVDIGKPYIVKLHAQWCPVCMLTKDEWAQIEAAYADRAKFLVFDSTTQASITNSRLRAEGFGLDAIWDDYVGASGLILVIDGGSHEIIAQIGGVQSFAEYQRAIDAVL